jgi:phage replication-related protein YjqB (UPF0714/DUF867 family)
MVTVKQDTTLDTTLPYSPSGRRMEEQCWVTPKIAADLLGLSLSHDFTKEGRRPQIRLVDTSKANQAIYTVFGLQDDPDESTVCMGIQAYNRWQALGFPDTGIVVETGVSVTTGTVKFAEQLTTATGTYLAILAPHGGEIEKYTDDQVQFFDTDPAAASLKQMGVQCWYCTGTGSPAWNRWHITADDTSELSFPLLATMISTPPRFTYAVAFHGQQKTEEVLIGGMASLELKQAIKDAIAPLLDPTILDGPGTTKTGADFIRLATATDEVGALRHENIVNRLARRGGIQLEQGAKIRRHWAPKIAAAVASVFQQYSGLLSSRLD